MPKGIYKHSAEHTAKLRACLARAVANRVARTECKFGHPLARGKNGVRFCPTCHHGSHLKTLFGITWDEKVAMYEKQRGLCGACGEPLPEISKCHTDHNHATGTVRELLHPRCNWLVGILEKYATLLVSIAAYIARWKGK
jgi:hypothetical protein